MSNVSIKLNDFSPSNIAIAIESYIKSNNLFKSSLLSLHNISIVTDCSLLESKVNEELNEMKRKFNNSIQSNVLIVTCISESLLLKFEEKANLLC